MIEGVRADGGVVSKDLSPVRVDLGKCWVLWMLTPRSAEFCGRRTYEGQVPYVCRLVSAEFLESWVL